MKMIHETSLPQGFTIRSPRLDDLQPIFALIDACETAEGNPGGMTEEELRATWQNPSFHREIDAWLVTDPAGQLLAYASIRNISNVSFYIVPRLYPGRFHNLHSTVRAYLLHQAESAIRQHYMPRAPLPARVTLNSMLNAANQTVQQDFEQAGYTHVRTDWRMEIQMLTPPPAPTWPAGISLRTFIPGQDERAAFQADDEAFMDHWGHIPGNYDAWAHWMFSHSNFDPTLWFLACSGNQIAGLSLCYNKNGSGFVGDLAVRRPWRRHGLGMALLLQSFGEFYRRGVSIVRLSADSQNLTGATRLYTRAGMHVISQHNQYQKQLRPGTEQSVISISD